MNIINFTDDDIELISEIADYFMEKIDEIPEEQLSTTIENLEEKYTRLIKFAFKLDTQSTITTEEMYILNSYINHYKECVGFSNQHLDKLQSKIQNAINLHK